MRWLATTLCVLTAALLAGAGCAESDGELRAALQAERQRAFTPVTRADIQREPSGSPSRAALEIWRALQYRDAQAGIAAMHPPPSKRALPMFERFFVHEGAAAVTSLRPRIRSVRVRGRRALLRVDILRTQKLGRIVDIDVAGVLPVEMLRVGGSWKLLWRGLLPALTGFRQ